MTGTNMLSPPGGLSTSNLLFDDEFTESALNAAYWRPWLGDATYGRWGDQGNLPSPYSGMNQNSSTFQVMYYDPYPYGYGTDTTGNHLVGGNGTLSLVADPSSYFSGLGYSWASAAVSSYGLVSLPATGGYVQWEAKMPDSQHGAWAGLWLLSPNGAEMDVQESGYLDGSANVNDVLASHWNGSGGSQIIQNTGIDLSAGYNTYGVEYVPGKSWTVYLNGKEMAQWTTGVPTNAAYELVMDVEMAGSNTSGWHTVANASAYPGPFELDIKDVQVYSLPGTTSGGGTSSSPTTPPAATTTSTATTTATTTAVAAPTVPSGLQATLVSGGEVDLAWTASSDAGSSVYGYDIYRDGNYIGFSATPNYADKTVTAGTSYQYQVLAYNPQHDASSLSSPLTVVAGADAPSVPTGLSATRVSRREVDLSWQASSDPASSIYGYDVYRDGSYLGFSYTPSYNDNTAKVGTSYEYQVLAYNPDHHTSALSAPLVVGS